MPTHLTNVTISQASAIATLALVHQHVETLTSLFVEIAADRVADPHAAEESI